MRSGIWLSLLVLGCVGAAGAREAEMVTLPAPQKSGGLPLMEALAKRHSNREFAARPLAPQELSNLLWAASGVNRPESGKRTAPSARDWREVDVYVATADGTFRYEPDTHTLRRVLAQDIRGLTGTQDFVAAAPVNLIYVADLERMQGTTAEHQALYSATDTGFIAQNVYLYCASAGLATVVRGSVDREALGTALGLGPGQRIILAQSVGHPRAGDAP
jgi:SagB-type dehydrogenase family enzyme